MDAGEENDIVALMQQLASRGRGVAPATLRGRRPKLVQLFESPEGQDLYVKMLTFIRAGCFDHVAASTIGIEPETFAVWMRKGRTQKRGIYRQFYRDVTQARNECRAIEETEILKTDPLSWLRLGPGRSKPGLDGWTEKIQIGGDNENPLQIQHTHGGNIKIDQHLTIDLRQKDGLTMAAETFSILEELQLIQRTEQGARLLEPPQEDDEFIIDVEAEEPIPKET